MLTPRYFFIDDFKPFYDYFLSSPHVSKTFQKGELLWRPGQPHEDIYYVISGSSMNYADHENGRRKIISFHGAGTVFPGYHRLDFRIELSLATVALTDMAVLRFTKKQFQKMFETNTNLAEQVVDWYARYVNRLLFETIHQEYNPSLVKLCDLLYLFVNDQTSSDNTTIEMTQETLAELLGLSRVQLTRELSELRKEGIVSSNRGKLHILDLPALAKKCSSEVI